MRDSDSHKVDFYQFISTLVITTFTKNIYFSRCVDTSYCNITCIHGFTVFNITVSMESRNKIITDCATMNINSNNFPLTGGFTVVSVKKVS